MDKRRNNGGNSTKTEGLDKRKNEYKDALSQAGDVDSVSKVLKMLYKKAVEKSDNNAAKIYLEYYLGKPHQSKDITTNGNDINISPIEWV
jgi:hypothetical protein